MVAFLRKLIWAIALCATPLFADLTCIRELEGLTAGMVYGFKFPTEEFEKDVRKAVKRLKLPSHVEALSFEDFDREVLKAAAVMLGLQDAKEFSGSILFSGTKDPFFDRETLLDELAATNTDAAILNMFVLQRIRHVLESLIVRGPGGAAALKELQTADEIIIATHQTRALQKLVLEWIQADPALSKLPFLSLIAPEYEPLLRETIQHSTVVSYSEGGEPGIKLLNHQNELSVPITAKKIHLTGGFCKDCLMRTMEEVAEMVFEVRDEVEFVIHARFAYEGDQKRSLVQLEEEGTLASTAQFVEAEYEVPATPTDASMRERLLNALHAAALDNFDDEYTGRKVGNHRYEYLRNDDDKKVILTFQYE